MARATAGMLLHCSYVEDYTLVLFRYRGSLRTNEYLTCHSGNFIINDLEEKGHMLLPDSKTATRHGRSNSVTLTDPMVLLFVSICRATNCSVTGCIPAVLPSSENVSAKSFRPLDGANLIFSGGHYDVVERQTSSNRPTARRSGFSQQVG